MRRIFIFMLIVVILGLLFVSSGNSPDINREFISNRPEPAAVQTSNTTLKVEKVKTTVDFFAEAVRAFNKEKYYKAISLFEKVPPEDPRFQEVASYLIQSRERAAIQEYSAARDKVAKGDMTGAIENLEEALYFNPEYVEARQLYNKLKEQQEAVLRLENKSKMKVFEGNGSVEVAVQQVQIKSSMADLTAEGGNIYICVLVNIKNNGKQMLRVIPNNFTLAATDGQSVSIDYGTYSLPDYLAPVDVKPGESAGGWLTFYIARKNQYLLSYNGYDVTVTKAIVP